MIIDKLLKVYIGKDERKKNYCLNLNKNFLIVDKNKQGQVLLFHKIIRSLIQSKLDVQIALIDYEGKYYKDLENFEKMFLPRMCFYVGFYQNSTASKRVVDATMQRKKYQRI